MNKTVDNKGIKDEDEIDVLSSDIFPFETDIMPSKGNSDFYKLRQSLILLESLRTQAVKDIDKLLELQDKALANPQEFVRKLANGEDLGIPMKLIIPDVPEINWGKYKIQVPLEAVKIGTRGKQQHQDEELKPPETNAKKIRGRVRDDTKPLTFNKLWTAEEQLKLEELLLKYPSGHNEARRFAKIAQELGTRTLSQVTSRCQKYFKKLHRAGLPVPGRSPRAPRMPEISRSNRVHKKERYGLFSSKMQYGTMFPPIIEDGDLPGTSNVDLSRIKEEPIELDDEDVGDEIRESDEYRKLMLIKRVQKSMDMYGETDNQPHHGYRCDICDEDPLTGTRWHCIDCGDDMSIDLCNRCLIAQLEGDEPHNLKHNWAAYRPANSVIGDTDYAYKTQDYNYLDPNFQPE